MHLLTGDELGTLKLCTHPVISAASANADETIPKDKKNKAAAPAWSVKRFPSPNQRNLSIQLMLASAVENSSSIWAARKNNFLELMDVMPDDTVPVQPRIVGLGDYGFHGDFIGLDSLMCDEAEHVLVCTKEGQFGMLNTSTDIPEFTARCEFGKNLLRMRYCKADSVVAIAGNERDLTLYDASTLPSKLGTELPQPIFKAKNVKNDWLDLRVPIHHTDLQYRQASKNEVVCAMESGGLRLYDIRQARRPVIDRKLSETPIRRIEMLDTDQVAYCNTTGDLQIYDIRNLKAVGGFKGFAGSIMDFSVYSTGEETQIASVGLDRCLRVHRVTDRKLLGKAYLKQRMTCVLPVDFDRDDPQGGESDEEVWEMMQTEIEGVRGVRKSSTDEKADATKKRRVK